MKDEYIIINKTTLLKRIEELETLEAKLMNEGMSYTATRAKIDELYYILHISTPLIPEIEKAWKSGKEYGICDWADFMGEPPPINKQYYISNLKLDI